MFRIDGKYTYALCMLPFESVEDAYASGQFEIECFNQIQEICNMEKFKNAPVRIMPDCHAGKGCVIGFTSEVDGFAIPNIVGVDISCSVSVYKLDTSSIDFEQLDKVIRNYIPSGNSVRQKISELVADEMKEKVHEVCEDIGDVESFDRHLRSIGSLGGGNHALEIDRGSDDGIYLMIHCGSRNFGKKICEYHQNVAIESYNRKINDEKTRILTEIPPQKRQEFLQNFKSKEVLKPELCYVEGEDLDLYIKHMKVAEEFATLNHKVILHEICSHMGWNVIDSIFTHHNYIEFLGGRKMVIRKGAISAKEGERVIIPLNMRDGSIIGVGKGNVEWNSSAPHGAGRVLSRAKAKETLSLDEFNEKMNGIWTSCISMNTIDESPMAYKDMNIILNSIGDSVEILDRIVPLYNFKAN